MDPGNSQPHAFPPTDWVPIHQAAASDSQIRAPALDKVLRTYLPALKKYLLRRKRLQEDDADEVLQNFVTEKILASRLLRQADESRGRFRNWLLTVLDRYLVGEWRKANRVRDIHATTLGDNFVSAADDAASEPPLGDPFEIDWARDTLHEVLTRMEAEYTHTNPRIWDLFRVRVLLPCIENAPEPSYEELVRTLHFESPTKAYNALITAKRAFGRLLRDVIGDYEPDENAIEDEIRSLWLALAKRPPAKLEHE